MCWYKFLKFWRKKPAPVVKAFYQPIEAVATAVPAFISYTEKAKQHQDNDLLLVPKRISSLAEYVHYFGGPSPEKNISVQADTSFNPARIKTEMGGSSPFLMYYQLRAYFTNGGVPCYIISTGTYGSSVMLPELEKGLSAAEAAEDVTLLLFPDAVNLQSASEYYALQKEALDQCQKLRDRFTILDVWMPGGTGQNAIQLFRDAGLGHTDVLQFGAAYYPFLETRFDYNYRASDVQLEVDNQQMNLADLQLTAPDISLQVEEAIRRIPLKLPPSAAIAGVYATTDLTKGVWKAPAGVNIDAVIQPTIPINDAEQAFLNVDPVGGKSINAIRTLSGRGPAIVWGARTLAGNDNEWRYVSVRRFCIMTESSIKKWLEPLKTEPNNSDTWTKVENNINQFLLRQWQAGALQGDRQAYAFFVKTGLNKTMTSVDIQNGRLIVDLGVALIRPADFVVLRIVQQMTS